LEFVEDCHIDPGADIDVFEKCIVVPERDGAVLGKSIAPAPAGVDIVAGPEQDAVVVSEVGIVAVLEVGTVPVPVEGIAVPEVEEELVFDEQLCP
jgi:hypothetical protein